MFSLKPNEIYRLSLWILSKRCLWELPGAGCCKGSNPTLSSIAWSETFSPGIPLYWSFLFAGSWEKFGRVATWIWQSQIFTPLIKTRRQELVNLAQLMCVCVWGGWTWHWKLSLCKWKASLYKHWLCEASGGGTLDTFFLDLSNATFPVTVRWDIPGSWLACIALVKMTWCV